MLERYLLGESDFSTYSKEELLVLLSKIQTSYIEEHVQAYTSSSVEKQGDLGEKTTEASGTKPKPLHQFRSSSLIYAVNQVNETIFALSEEGIFLFANKQFLREYPQERIEGVSAIGIVLSCPTRNEWELLKERIRANNGTYSYVIEKYEEQQSLTSYEIVVHHSLNVSGEEEFWFFCRNVTERMNQERKIKELNALMDVILSNAPLYLFAKDTERYQYLYCNKALERQIGIKSKDAVGKTDYEIFPNAHDAEKFRRDDSLLVQQNTLLEHTEELTNIDGERRIVKTIKTLIHREKLSPIIVGVSLDITDLKKTEEKLIAAKQEAEQSNMLKSAFLANMSHEIRTPLNAIVGFAKLIMTEDDRETQAEFVDIIDRNADLLLQLINDILDLSKIEAGTLDFTLTEFDLEELCNDMYEVHSMKVSPSVSLKLHRQEQNLIVKSDRNRLAQVFTNLLSNSIKFTEKGEINFGYSLFDDRIEMFVEDSGMGISAEKLPYIFDRFVKLNSFVQGTGLGLSITRTIMERLNGSIAATSKEGKGTRFVFTIPRLPLSFDTQKEEVAAKGKHPHLEHGDEEVNQIILVVEDNESNYQLIKRYLGNKYEHYRAVNGKEAVELFQKHRPALILMDIKLPEMDGLEATKIIKSMSPNIPVVAITAHAYDNDKEEAYKVGVDYFLSKPVSFAKLQDILDTNFML